MVYFSNEFIDFFKELAPNNNKDWFDLNRKRYTQFVKDPFKKFIEDLIAEASKKNKRLAELEPKDCIFRINRDIRFSKDKTPYKLNLSALIAEGGRKNYSSEGLYVELGPEHVRVYGGIYKPEKAELQKIREGISSNLAEFKKLCSDKKFLSTYGEIKGEKNKIIPKELKEKAAEEPMIFNKQFYYFAEFKPEIMCQDDFMETILKQYEIARPMEQFFTKILNR